MNRYEITLEKQLELEMEIKSKDRWEAFKEEIAYLHKEMREKRISEKEYLSKHKISTICFACLPDEFLNNRVFNLNLGVQI